jgi:hypothetical protein
MMSIWIYRTTHKYCANLVVLSIEEAKIVMEDKK